MWTDVGILSSVESRPDVNHTFLWTMKDSSGALAYQCSQKAYNKKLMCYSSAKIIYIIDEGRIISLNMKISQVPLNRARNF